ncbi:MAG TPA: response regulator transcription factor [Solirubrobacteraceae bacterium]|nr:response regulator transcription factor [Solirubrobacteraceae bacterium]
MTQATQSRGEVLDVGPLQIIPDEHLARAEGRALMLSIRELRLLTELARRADRIVSREELFRLVWGREMRAHDRSVDVYIRKLRVKLEAALPAWSFIHTHFGLGYRMTAEDRHVPIDTTKTSRSQRGNNGRPAGAETLPQTHE